MAATGLAIPVWSLVNSSGAPLSGAKINSWVPDSNGAPTATRRTLYTDPGLTTPASNPYTLGTSGHGVLYRRPTQAVVLTITDSAGVTTYASPHYPIDLSTTGGASLATFVVANNAALTALTEATGLVDNGIYQTLGKSTERDGGEGLWVYDSASTTTATTGTVLAIDGGGAGRFFRLYNKEDFASIEWFGGNNDGSTTNTAAYNAWLTAATAGTAPKTLRFGNGTYLFSTKPDKIQTPGIRIVGSDYTVVKKGWTSADKTEGVFHWYGNSPFGHLEGMALGTADTFEGGALFKLEATASAAPDLAWKAPLSHVLRKRLGQDDLGGDRSIRGRVHSHWSRVVSR